MKLGAEDGFTIIELVVTMVVLSITFMSVFSLFDTLHGINSRADHLAVATEVAQREMELYRNIPYNTIAVGTTDVTSALSSYPTLGSTRSASVAVTQVDARGLKQVEVTVNYYDHAIPRKVVLDTLVAQNGINK